MDADSAEIAMYQSKAEQQDHAAQAEVKSMQAVLAAIREKEELGIADAKNAGNRRRVPVSSRSVPVRASLVPAQDRARAGVAGIRGRRLGTSASGQEVRMALFSLLRATRLFNDANDWLEMGMNVPEVCGVLPPTRKLHVARHSFHVSVFAAIPTPERTARQMF